MFRRLIVGSYRAGRKAVKSCASLLKERASSLRAANVQIGAANAPVAQRIRRKEQNPLYNFPTMQDILAERPALLEQIGWTAEQGMVPDGLPLRLRANHEAELNEHRRLLAEDRLGLQAGLRRLAALFPPLPAPEPEPATPRRPRDFSPLGDLLARRPKGRLN